MQVILICLPLFWVEIHLFERKLFLVESSQGLDYKNEKNNLKVNAWSSNKENYAPISR